MIFNSYTIKCLKKQYLYCVLSLSKNLWSHTWRIQYCAKMFSQASPLIKFGFK